MIDIKEFKVKTVCEHCGQHMLVCTFMEMDDMKSGVLKICGEPADIVANGLSTCMTHYKIIAAKSVEEFRKFMESQSRIMADEDEDVPEIETSADIKVPDYLR